VRHCIAPPTRQGAGSADAGLLVQRMQARARPPCAPTRIRTRQTLASACRQGGNCCAPWEALVARCVAVEGIPLLTVTREADRPSHERALTPPSHLADIHPMQRFGEGGSATLFPSYSKQSPTLTQAMDVYRDVDRLPPGALQMVHGALTAHAAEEVGPPSLSLSLSLSLTHLPQSLTHGMFMLCRCAPHPSPPPSCTNGWPPC
jgi:hypothetical protein